MARKGKPIGRIDGGTQSIGAAVVSQTISIEDTLPNTLPSAASGGDFAAFAELRAVPRSNYIIGEPIAQGGMGVILDARDRRTGRALAIKEVRADVMARDPAAVRAAVVRFAARRCFQLSSSTPPSFQSTRSAASTTFPSSR